MALHYVLRPDQGLPITRLFYELSPPPHAGHDLSPQPRRMNQASSPADQVVTETPSGKTAKVKRFRHSRNRPYFYKPYDFPWRSKLEESYQTLSESMSLEKDTESAPPTVSVSRQDSGNKSNPGSPVKSQHVAPNDGCSIIRSRSLDDLNIAKISLYDRLVGRIDIDLVSQRINNLHVN